MHPLLRTATLSKGVWWSAPKYAAIDADGVSKRAAAIADFRNWRFAITTVAAGSIAGATAAQLGAMRSCTFAEWFSFTSGGGTYIDVDGTLKTAASNAPRRDYSTGAGRFGLNNAATNLCIWSNDPTQTGWNADGGVFSLVNGVARWVQPASGGIHYPRSNWATFVANTTYTISGEIRSFGADSPSFYPSGWNGTAWVDGPQIALSATWTKFSFTFTTGATMSSQYGVGWKHTGTSGTGFEFRRVQIEAGSFASPYIPTTSSSVTRPVETAQFGAIATALMQRSAATVVVRGVLLAVNGYRRIVGVGGGGSSTYNGPTDDVRVWDGISEIGQDSFGTGSLLTGFGTSLAYGAGGFACSTNGGSAATTTSSNGWAASAATGVWLAKSTGADPENSATPNPGYGNGFYDEVVIFPFRVANTDLPRLAVPYA